MSFTRSNPSYKYGKRLDGSPKGRGYFGELQRPDGRISTELSVGVEMDGKEIEIPSLVPTLNKNEVKYLLSHKKPTKTILRKAILWARKRRAAGKPVFATQKDKISLLDLK